MWTSDLEVLLSAPGSLEEYRKFEFVRQWIGVDSRGDDFRKVSPHYAGLRSCPRRSFLKRFTHNFYVKVDWNPGDGSLHTWKSGDSTSQKNWQHLYGVFVP